MCGWTAEPHTQNNEVLNTTRESYQDEYNTLQNHDGTLFPKIYLEKEPNTRGERGKLDGL